jgi:ubiquinone/menaquinone biosynthesis C-methylase UbiE
MSARPSTSRFVRPAIARTNQKLVSWMDKTFYPSFAGRWDDDILRRDILAVLKPHHHVIDVGAGAGIVQQMHFRGLAAKVCGVDLNQRVLENPHLDEAHVASAESIPYSDGSFDLAFADNVLEHLQNPIQVFREVARVLRPGGHFLVKTPNRWHYMPIIASLTPDWFHHWFHTFAGNNHADIFPTTYRANSVSRLHELAEGAGLEVMRCVTYEGRPEYLRMAAPAYAVGWAYERIVNSSELLKEGRILLVAEFRKPRTNR